jgi:CheY-like chemotaxis protein
MRHPCVAFHSHRSQGSAVHLKDRNSQSTDQNNVSAPRILLVEDSDVVRMLTVEVLKELGYQVLEAINAQQALQVLDSNENVDLLMTDIGLPGMNGQLLAAAARQRRPELKVLFASGYIESLDDNLDCSSKRTNVIGKPFSIDALRTTVHNMLAG